MSKLQTRLERIEQVTQASKGKRIFVIRGDAITEGGVPKSESDIGDAERMGYEVIVLRVVYVDTPKE